MIKKSIRWIVVMLCCMWIMTGCGATETMVQAELTGQPVLTQEPVATPEPTPEPTPNPTPTPIPTPTPFVEYDIDLMMVGDNLMHMGIIKTGKQEDGSYNYDFLFEGIADYLETADIKIINQETIFGGNNKGFSGYPYFNSPTEVGDAIAKAGFNVVLHSSNHVADMGLSGIQNCVDFWEQYPEVMTVGIYGEKKLAQVSAGDSIAQDKTAGSASGDSVVEADTQNDVEAAKIAEIQGIAVMEIEGVTFAILNYTYGPNMETLPNNIEGHLDMLCAYDDRTGRIDFTTLNAQVITEIQLAETLADVVIVCPHWGTEYTTKPSSYQKKFAMQMVEAGADVLIGTHPHVVQPVEWIEAENGNKALCYYSLGNYVSTQKQALCMLEAMAWITFRVTEEGVVIVEEETGVLPLVCHYNAMPVEMESVYLLEDYTEEQAASHGITAYGGVNLLLSDLQNWTNEVFEGWILTSEQILNINQ